MRIQGYMRTTQPAFNHTLEVALTLADNVMTMTNPYYGAFKILKVTIPTANLIETITQSSTFDADRTKIAGYDHIEITVPKGVLTEEIAGDADFYAPTTIAGYDEVHIKVLTGTKTITENGTYTKPDSIAGWEQITVDVEPVLDTLSVTENGTYTPPTGTDGYSEVTVNVQGGGGVIEPITITENGTTTAPTGTDGYNPITVNVTDPPSWGHTITYKGSVASYSITLDTSQQRVNYQGSVASYTIGKPTKGHDSSYDTEE